MERLIDEHHPQLVLLDLMLPETDGIELMEAVPALKELPVIFLSAYGGDRRVARALEMGAEDYIVKPFPPRSWSRGFARSCAAGRAATPLSRPARTRCTT